MALYSFAGDDLQPVEEEVYPESQLEDWLESNPQVLGDGDPVVVIGRQVTSDAGPVDLLALTPEGDLVIVELKRRRTPREAIAQALDYHSVLQRWSEDDIRACAESYRQKTKCSWATVEEALASITDGGAEAAAVAPPQLNQCQHIWVAARIITPAVRRMAESLNQHGYSVRCIEFAAYRTATGGRVAEASVVVRAENTITGPAGGPAGSSKRRSWTVDGVLDQLEVALEGDQHAWEVVAELDTFARGLATTGTAVWMPGTGAAIGNVWLRLRRSPKEQISCFGLSTTGKVGIFYDDLGKKLSPELCAWFITALAELPTFSGIRSQIERREWGFGSQWAAMQPLTTAFREEGELQRFEGLVLKLRDSVREADAADAAGASP